MEATVQIFPILIMQNPPYIEIFFTLETEELRFLKSV